MEEFRCIKGYANYQVSNLGIVRSLKFNKEKILKQGVNRHGYKVVVFSENNNQKMFSVHQLVAIAFLNHNPCGFKLVVNHINFNKTDNRVENLEVVTTRENANKKHIKSSSKYVGVSWAKRYNKWRSYINIGSKQIHLGYFDCELAAVVAYNNKLKTIK